MSKYNIENEQLLEYPLPVMVQSGSNFTINKFNVDCDDSYIGSEVIYANICAKYSEMQGMVSRTLLFNPTDKQKEAYQLAFDAQNHLIEKLRPGALIKEAFNSTLKFIKDKDSSLADKIHTNLGFGIGCNYKEDELSINPDNSTKIEAGMVFHVRITFRDVQKPASKGVIAIGDTVLVS